MQELKSISSFSAIILLNSSERKNLFKSVNSELFGFKRSVTPSLSQVLL